jgi:endonuclease/exonuclease/phosphatase (EEP) superfamily protein YafD
MLRSEVSTATSMSNVIVSGDFNSTRSHSKFRHILDAGYEDAADVTGSGLIPTYPTDKSYPPVVGIDHVLTRGARATALEPVSILGSDHAGLVAEIQLR